MPPKHGKGGAFGGGASRASGASGASGSGAGAAAAAPPRAPAPLPPAALAALPTLPVAPTGDLIALPRRPGAGAAGRRIALFANHFALTGTLPAAVLRFHVDVVPPPRLPPRGGGAPPAPKALPSVLCRDLLSEVASRLGWGDAWAYDGAATVYATTDLLPSTRFGETLKLPLRRPDRRGGEEEFSVEIRGLGTVRVAEAVTAFFAAPATPLPAEALAVLDVVMHHRRALQTQHWAAVGRSFLNRGDTRPLGAGLEVWLGYSASVRPAQARAGGAAMLSLVLDRAAAAFVTAQPVMDLVYAVTNGMSPPFDDRTRRKVTKALRGLKIEVSHAAGQKRQYRARGATRMPAAQAVFRNDELGGNDTVAAYFDRKNPTKKLQYPQFPCVDASASPAKPLWLPMELCTVVAGQRRQLVDDPAASAAMIKVTASKPGERWRSIEASVKDHVTGDGTLRAFGLGVAASMKQLDGRILPTPALEYGGGQRLTVPPGSGAWNLASARLLTPGAAPAAWAAVVCDNRDEAKLTGFIRPFLDGLFKTAGIKLPAMPVRGVPQRGEALEDMLVRVLRSSPAVTFVLCVADGSKETYERVKRLLDEQLGVISQCMLAKHLGAPTFGGGGGRGSRDGGRGGGRDGGGRGGGGGGPSMQYIANLSQKINAKLGGTNTRIAALAGSPSIRIQGISEVPTMLFGADVTHPSPGSGAASIAAVVGSLDGNAGQYAARLAAQPGGQESIAGLGGMVVELLREFHTRTRQKPERIIFFRDGVSEGQFQDVLRKELPQLRDALASLGNGSYAPAITFLVVQKRHHTRLFVGEDRDADRSGNVPAGTVVDTAICHPHEHDFFLMSHAGIQGTSRPVHYHVLLDENQYSADVLQAMCFSLCHLYCRCTRSVSMVPPVYYAHLAAYRGRVLRAAADASDSGSTASGAVGAARGGAMDVHDKLKQTMFFV